MSAIKGALTRARTKGKPGRKHVGSPLQIRAKDVDIVELNKGAVTKVAKTQRGYNGVLKQFADFAEVEWSGESLDEFPKRLLTDEMMAKFLWYRAEKNPTNNAKATMAALASACLHHAVPNVYDNDHLYPHVHKRLGVMAVAKKANPIAALKAGIFSPAAILHVLKSKPRDNLEIQHFGLWCWETFTGVRSQTTWD